MCNEGIFGLVFIQPPSGKFFFGLNLVRRRRLRRRRRLLASLVMHAQRGVGGSRGQSTASPSRALKKTRRAMQAAQHFSMPSRASFDMFSGFPRTDEGFHMHKEIYISSLSSRGHFMYFEKF